MPPYSSGLDFLNETEWFKCCHVKGVRTDLYACSARCDLRAGNRPSALNMALMSSGVYNHTIDTDGVMRSWTMGPKESYLGHRNSSINHETSVCEMSYLFLPFQCSLSKEYLPVK